MDNRAERMELEPHSALRTTGLSWNQPALEDVLRTDYVWAVLVTDGQGGMVKKLERQEMPARFGQVVDLALSALGQLGKKLEAGELRVVAQIFESAMVVSARAPGLGTATAVAAPNANLGQLLSGIKRVVSAKETRG